MAESSAAAFFVTAALQQAQLFPIREVARLTGVNPVTLRAWERRYGLIQPTRTDSGHRLYSHADVEAIRSILGWLERGVAVSKVGTILARSSQSKAASAPAYAEGAAREWAEWQTQLRRAIADFDEGLLERLYGQVFASYPLGVVFEDILMPLWQALLLRQDGFGQTSEWLFLDTFLRARTLQRLQLSRGPGEARVLLAAMPGHCRELELLVAGLLLDAPDLGIGLLGLGQPLNELTLICEKRRPEALVLFSQQPPAEGLVRQLSKLALGLGCPLALAGAAAELGAEGLSGSPIACLGAQGRAMQQRLRQLLGGRLDT